VSKAKPDSGSASLVELCLPATGDTTRVILGKVVKEVQRVAPALDQGSLQIVLSEALNNIIEHGYCGDPLGAVALRVGVCDGAVIIETWDWGLSYPEGDIPQGISPDPAALPEGGFGWFLIKSLTREIRYRRAHECNLCACLFTHEFRQSC
jgi:serine/threonine-protein kinase RsbW